MSQHPFTNGPLKASAFTRDDTGTLCCEGRSLAQIAAEFGTPTFVYSERMIASAYQAFAEPATAQRALICYALKANSNLAIIRLLAKQGAGFDIVSLGELERVLAAGGRADRIVFSGVGKKPAEIRAALTAGIKCINVESEAELEMVSQAAVALGLSAPISLRVNPDIDAKTHPYISTGLKENKFGIPMAEALRIYQKAISLPGISVQGIDCHIGSQITTLQPFLDSLDKVLLLTDQLRQAGIVIHHLDLGGGLGICYDNETPPAPAEMLNALFARITGWAKANQIATPEILFEFGRAIVGNAGVLLTSVELLKPSPEKNFAVIDAAMNDLMRPALYEAWHGVEPVKTGPHTSEAKPWDLVGPVCESGDWLAKDRHLALQQGDVLALLSAGAYGMSMSSNYNSRPRAAEVLVAQNGDLHLIRRREQFEDLIGPERIPNYLRD
ncbi:diaminopimelate decarboxylase [beta proteobacterium MWH-UniP1]